MLTVCVTSGKGGVGKTTLSVNLGIAIARAGHRVLLLDGDLGLANLNVMLDVRPKYNIQDIVTGRRTLQQVIIPTAYGIDLLAGATGIAELADLREPERQSLIRGLAGLRGYDVLIIDTGAGIGDNVIRFVLASDEILLMTTPHPTSLTDAYGTIKSILSNESRSIKLIVNSVSSIKDARNAAERLVGVTDKFLDGSLECIGYIPSDGLIEKSIMQRKPHIVINPSSSSAQTIQEIAMRLIGRQATDSKKGFGRFLQRMFG